MSDDPILGLTRVVGGLETSVANLEKRMDRSESAIIQRLNEHDESSRTGMQSLRQDFVHAQENMLQRIEANAIRVDKLEGDRDERAGANKLWQTLDRIAHKYLPWLLTGAAFVIAWLK